jgi:hypothetical protein
MIRELSNSKGETFPFKKEGRAAALEMEEACDSGRMEELVRMETSLRSFVNWFPQNRNLTEECPAFPLQTGRNVKTSPPQDAPKSVKSCFKLCSKTAMAQSC